MKVKFLPMEKELEIKPGQSVMNLAHENGINILSVCNGMPSCAECRVKVVENDHNVLPPSSKELSLIGTGYFLDQRRLSCQLLCFGDITVDTTEQIEKANEAKVNKKFLKRAQKVNAEDSHSLNGILIEQDTDLVAEVSRESDNRRGGNEGPQRDGNVLRERPQGGGEGRQAREGGREGGRQGGGQQRNDRGGRNNSNRNRNDRSKNSGGQNNRPQQQARAGGAEGTNTQAPRSDSPRSEGTPREGGNNRQGQGQGGQKPSGQGGGGNRRRRRR